MAAQTTTDNMNNTGSIICDTTTTTIEHADAESDTMSNVQVLRDDERELESSKFVMVGDDEGDSREAPLLLPVRTLSLRGEEAIIRPPASTMRRWVDQCSRRPANGSSDRSYYSSTGSSTSSESGSSISRSSVKDASTTSSSSSSSPEGSCLLESRKYTTRRGRLAPTTSRVNFAREGGGDAAAGLANPHHHNKDNNDNNGHSRVPRVIASQVRRAQRLPLLDYHHYNSGNNNISSSNSSSGTQNPFPNNNRISSIRVNNSGVFAWFVLLHGCLCEAPLAVIEGIVRAPFYLVAAAWVLIVGYLVGTTSRHSEHHHRAGLLRRSAALAREGILLLLASLTLAVPFSTSCTVYRGVDPDNEWDVRPVPTVIGAVDPLRFFVFAFGQAGELAANGQPESLLLGPSNSSSPPVSFSSSSSSSAAAAATVTDAFSSSMADIEMTTAPVEREQGSSEEGRNYCCSRSSTHRRSRSSSSSSIFLNVNGGVIAAQSMDEDRLGVGILHPPHAVELRCRRVGASARRAAVSAYRRLSSSATRFMRRNNNLQ